MSSVIFESPTQATITASCEDWFGKFAKVSAHWSSHPLYRSIFGRRRVIAALSKISSNFSVYRSNSRETDHIAKQENPALFHILLRKNCRFGYSSISGTSRVRSISEVDGHCYCHVNVLVEFQFGELSGWLVPDTWNHHWLNQFQRLWFLSN